MRLWRRLRRRREVRELSHEERASLHAGALAAGAGAYRRPPRPPRQAEQLAREAIAISERTDSPNLQGDALCDLAEVLHAAGRSDEAAAALGQALERYEQTKNRAMSAQVRERLAELQGVAPR